MNNLKVVVLGASGVGKTSLTTRFVNGEFVENYDPTIEDLYRKVIETNKGENYMMEIMDISGTERFLAMRDLYIRNAQAFILVYSITSRVSLLELENIKNLIVQVKEKPLSTIPIAVLGNKCDLEEHRSVSSEEGESLCKKWGVGDFLETSAKIEMNIQSAFDCLIKQVASKPQYINSPKKSKNQNHSSLNSSLSNSGSSASLSNLSNLSNSSSSNSSIASMSMTSSNTSISSLSKLSRSPSSSSISKKSKSSSTSSSSKKLKIKNKCSIM
ncbi:hypothetical protein CYY_007060 [Polysphondylium violaceum]|uniref:small monomeric GTPase n=1 Tax=Polysphondylium violaceum TaxID=133409 RepID=A0A8J4PQ48_9MYCE|nr:hypothetical protein CYY_007060 [Polysphondylium violaceum]